ncbi:Bis(5'-nucleosyl)-tetraphosphatase, symmetrical [Metarhizium brunneum]|uniref:Bis(5'-nucleosyl)-tetraphosphatase, symmetrical n=1 Tax=Metarhizium brunneum TaxID=500148 RepID=A0A7D5UXR9_9HYPO
MIVPRHKCAVLLAVVIANVAICMLAFLYTTQHWELEGLAVSSSKHRRPKPPNLTLTASVPKHYVPTVENGRRLLVIGDIHGMNTELGNLLDLAKYDAATDHVITLGDMVNKGPDSRGVLSRLMSLNASAVRGNHDDRLLLALREDGAQAASPTGQEDAVLAARKRDKKILKVAKTLLPEQITWLSGLPVILKSPALRLYFVHGGLVPGVKLDKQDPWAVMNMRTLRYSQDDELRRRDGHSSAQAEPEDEDEYDDDDDDDEGSEVTPAQKVVAIPIDDHSGQRWDKAWNKYQRKFVKKSHRRTVMYGHDAKRGFTEGRYTVGLDSGCAAGGHLTGLIVRARGRGGISYDKIQVPCKAA